MSIVRVRELQKWGNSAAVRIPKDVLGKAELSEGDSVTFEVTSPGVIVMRSVREKVTLAEMAKRITPEREHPETD